MSENNNMTTNAAGDNLKGTNAANNTTNDNGIHYYLIINIINNNHNHISQVCGDVWPVCSINGTFGAQESVCRQPYFTEVVTFSCFFTFSVV